MTTRDIAWRGAGVVIFAVACTGSVMARIGDGGLNGLLCFALALVGAVLIIHGKRVPLAWRVERSRHRDLVAAIRARRRQDVQVQVFDRKSEPNRLFYLTERDAGDRRAGMMACRERLPESVGTGRRR